MINTPRDRDKPEEMTKLTEEVGSDPDLLENKFVEYFKEELDNRLNDLETALKTAGGS